MMMESLCVSIINEYRYVARALHGVFQCPRALEIKKCSTAAVFVFEHRSAMCARMGFGVCMEIIIITVLLPWTAGCPVGYTGEPCSACPAGTYKPASGLQSCTNCDAGKYSTTVGAYFENCLGCNPGKFSLTPGAP